ncbi:MAG: hypothetical protein KDB69_07675 [Acidimicrobiia bacterium]|nr:hypothetical protein [Acidimicrobiia bacterium]
MGAWYPDPGAALTTRAPTSAHRYRGVAVESRIMSRGHSNAVLVMDLLHTDGPFTHIADTFVAARCAGCGGELAHDPRHGEWGSYCAACLPERRTA